MSIESMMRHKAEVWRPTRTTGIYGEIVDVFTKVTDPTANNAEPFVLDHALGDEGPGERLVGRKKWVMRKGTNVQSRDVLNVISGDEAPSRWLVLSTYYPRGHHWEMLTESYVGSLPPDDEVEEGES